MSPKRFNAIEVRAKQRTLDCFASMARIWSGSSPARTGLTATSLGVSIHLGSGLKSGNLVFRAAFNDLKFAI